MRVLEKGHDSWVPQTRLTYYATDNPDDYEITAGRTKWRLPIRGGGQAIISLPEDITPEDWNILKIQLDAFIIPNTGKTP
jgi:hypothetical protein